MNRHTLLLAIVFTAVSLLAGCGVGSKDVNGIHVAPNHTEAGGLTFINRTGDMRVAPNAKFDAEIGERTSYTNISVLDSSGRHISLNASATPLFFEAYWCPHCQRTLVLWNKNRNGFRHMPLIVSMGFPPGTTLHEAVRVSDAEMNAFHIRNLAVYYLLGANAAQFVKEYPTLLFPWKGKVALLQGEHTLGVWQRALN